MSVEPPQRPSKIEIPGFSEALFQQRKNDFAGRFQVMTPEQHFRSSIYRPGTIKGLVLKYVREDIEEDLQKRVDQNNRHYLDEYLEKRPRAERVDLEEVQKFYESKGGPDVDSESYPNLTDPDFEKKYPVSGLNISISFEEKKGDPVLPKDLFSPVGEHSPFKKILYLEMFTQGVDNLRQFSDQWRIHVSRLFEPEDTKKILKNQKEKTITQMLPKKVLERRLKITSSDRKITWIPKVFLGLVYSRLEVLDLSNQDLNEFPIFEHIASLKKLILDNNKKIKNIPEDKNVEIVEEKEEVPKDKNGRQRSLPLWARYLNLEELSLIGIPEITLSLSLAEIERLKILHLDVSMDTFSVVEEANQSVNQLMQFHERRRKLSLPRVAVYMYEGSQLVKADLSYQGLEKFPVLENSQLVKALILDNNPITKTAHEEEAIHPVNQPNSPSLSEKYPSLAEVFWRGIPELSDELAEIASLKTLYVDKVLAGVPDDEKSEDTRRFSFLRKKKKKQHSPLSQVNIFNGKRLQKNNSAVTFIFS